VGTAEQRIRQRYASFRELLELNTECLEVLSGLQEDLREVPPLRDALGGRITTIFDEAERIVAALGKLTGPVALLQRGSVQRGLSAIRPRSARCTCDAAVGPDDGKTL